MTEFRPVQARMRATSGGSMRKSETCSRLTRMLSGRLFRATPLWKCGSRSAEYYRSKAGKSPGSLDADLPLEARDCKNTSGVCDCQEVPVARPGNGVSDTEPRQVVSNRRVGRCSNLYCTQNRRPNEEIDYITQAGTQPGPGTGKELRVAKGEWSCSLAARVASGRLTRASNATTVRLSRIR